MQYQNLFLLSLLLLISSCKNEKTKVDKNTIETPETMTEIPPSTLAEKLNAKKEAFLATADTVKINDYEAGIKAVSASGVLENALNVGDTAPDFKLLNANKDTVSLYNELEKGDVVLVWYRGGWCPYCNITLHYLQEKLPEFKAKGAQLVALTPELPDNSISTKEKNELAFEVLSDVGNVVARDFGVVYTLPEKIAEYYSSFGLNEYNGDDSNTLPLSATYVIGQNHKIKFAFLDADYRNRAEPNDILAAIK